MTFLLTPADPALRASVRLGEGLRLKAYPDPESPLAKQLLLAASRRVLGWAQLSGSPWTIGYGHTGPDVRAGVVWTEDQAESALTVDLGVAIDLLDHHVDWWRGLSPNRQRVLAELCFNMGWDDPRTPQHEGLSGFVHTLAAMQCGDVAGACAGLRNSKWAQQTKTRADRLIALYQQG